jgi:fatty-acyl-CoA synthase
LSQRNEPAASYVWQALDTFSSFGDREAIVYLDRRLSYADVVRGVLTMATSLQQHGIQPGSAVAVLTGTPPESILIQLGLHMLGCRSVWIAPNAPTRYRIDFLRMAQVEAFVYDMSTHKAMGEPLAAELPHLKVFCFGPGGIGPDLTDLAAVTTAPVTPDEISDEPQSLFQTGGTTGRPKLVHHRHSHFLALHAISQFFLASGGTPPRHLAISGYWHASSQTAGMMTLLTGGTLFLQHGFEADDFLTAVERERVTSTLIPPPVLYMLLDDPRLHSADLSSLNMISVGGAAAAPARLAQAIERFGTALRPVYGMSEATFITAYPNLDFDPAHPQRLGSCGTAYADVRIEIRDDNGKVLSPGQNGEIWVSGRMLMAGYWGEPELTHETVVDGWLRTGDVGHLDEDGYLFIVDRSKDMIITGQGSTNVYCRPIEDALLAHPAVRGAAVVGLPDPALGEVVNAFVVIAPGASVTPAELRALVVAELNELWAPRAVHFVDSLPLTEMGKVDKKELRARYGTGSGDDGDVPAGDAPA